MSPEDSVGASYSPALFARIVSQPAGTYLAGALGDPDGR